MRQFLHEQVDCFISSGASEFKCFVFGFMCNSLQSVYATGSAVCDGKIGCRFVENEMLVLVLVKPKKKRISSNVGVYFVEKEKN